MIINIMTLRFEVDQATAFRRGVNVPKSTNHIEVDPETLSQKERDLIADRLNGIDVCALDAKGNKLQRIVAEVPTYDSLLYAICQNETSRKNNHNK